MRIYVLALTALAAATSDSATQGSEDVDSSGRIVGMPLGRDRYRKDDDQGCLRIPLDKPIQEVLLDPMSVDSPCDAPSQHNRKQRRIEKAAQICR